MPEHTSKENIHEVLTTAQDVINLYTQLEKVGIKIWIDGGWSVDALIGKQLRPHKDVDIALQWKDVPKLREILSGKGYKQVREDSQWNFVLADDNGHEVDVHAFIYDDAGNIVEGVMYPTESLTGTGTIDGYTIRCISPEHMVQFLAPWIHKWPGKYLQAVSELCEKFGIELPEEHTRFTTENEIK